MSLYFNQSMHKLKSERGFGIIEVMVAAALMLIIAVGMSSLITSMQREQRKQALMQVLVSQKTRFENAILNPSSWANTLATAPSMACLRTNVACSTITQIGAASQDITTYQELILQDGATPTGVFYNGTGANGSKQGFTENGTVCNNFTAVSSGDSTCPIGYRVSWGPQNQADVNPKITVFAKMIFNPGNDHPFKKFFNAEPGVTTLNAKYDVQIDRTGTTTAKVFTVAYESIPTGGAGSQCATGGYGACTVAPAWGDFPGTRVIYDPHDLIDDASSATLIRIRSPGKLKCNAKSYAFGTNGANLQISKTLPAATFRANTFASAANYGYSTIIMDTVIDITAANTDLSFQQNCEAQASGGTDPGIASCSLGFAGFPYSVTAVQTATLNCILVD